MKLEKLLEKLDYQCLRGALDIDVSDVVYHTGKLQDECAFVCIRGAKLDGHTLAQQAVSQGARALIVEEDVPVEGVTVIQVENTRIALANMAAAYFDYPAEKLTTIGVTGSKGKTTTVYMMKAILEKAGYKVGLMGSIGALIDQDPVKTINTTPESYEIQRLFREMVDAGCTHVAMEASSQGFKLHRTSGFVFDYGIFLNIARDHISPWEHATLEEYLACKSQLLKQSKEGVLNSDDPHIDDILEGHICNVHTFGFGKDAMTRVAEYAPIRHKGHMGVHYRTEGEFEQEMYVASPGKFSVYDSLSVACVAQMCGISEAVISTALEDFQVFGRVEVIPIDAPYTVLIDFAHNGIGIENLMKAVSEYEHNRLIAVFGSDGDRTKIRRADAGEILGNLADLTILTSNSPRFEKVEDINNDIKVGLDKTDGEYIEIIDRRSAIKYAMSIAQPKDMILLIGKGHWKTEEIQGVHYPFDERVVIPEIYEELMQTEIN